MKRLQPPHRQQAFVLRRLAWSASALMSWLLFASGCAKPANQNVSPICEPTSYVFCRCADGSAGTKKCHNDGLGFDECSACEGEAPPPGTNNPAAPIPPVVTVSSSASGSGAGGAAASSSTGAGAAGSTSSGAGASGPTGHRALLETCSDHSECQSGLCESNYCTIPCKKVSDCPYPSSECVLTGLAAEARCMPSCQTAVDCKAYGTPTSRCSHASAIDSFRVNACAHWGEQQNLVPFGTSCTPLKHSACNLGYQGRQTVCTEQGVCAKGCYVNKDCPQGMSCSAQGELGTCQ